MGDIIKYNTLDRTEVPDIVRTPIHLVLDNIRSAFNVGSAFRTADSVRVEKIYLTGISSYPPNPKLDKTALNSTESVPWQYYPQTSLAIAELKEKNIPICAVELTNTSKNFWEYQFPKPVALVFGHELDGVSEEILSVATSCVCIPMFGKKSTLNVSTSLGVVMFEVLRQWRLS